MHKRRNPQLSPGVRGWRRRELNQGPRGVQSAFVHVRSRITQPTGFGRFGGRPSSRFSRPCHPEHWRDPALVLTPFRYQNYLSVGRLYCFLGSESDCIVVCNWYGPILERVGCLHTQTNLQSPRRNRSPPRGCGYGHHSYRAAPVKAFSSSRPRRSWLPTWFLAAVSARRPGAQPAYISMPIVKRYCQ